MSLKYSIDFTVVFSKSLYLYSHKKCHSLPGISEKGHNTAKLQKTEFDKYSTSGVIAFSITSSYLIQFILDQNCHDSY